MDQSRESTEIELLKKDIELLQKQNYKLNLKVERQKRVIREAMKLINELRVSYE